MHSQLCDYIAIFVTATRNSHTHTWIAPCIYYAVRLHLSTIWCRNEFIRGNKTVEFTDCDARIKKNTQNNISSSSNSTPRWSKMVGSTTITSTKSRAGYDMVYSRHTLKKKCTK